MKYNIMSIVLSETSHSVIVIENLEPFTVNLNIELTTTCMSFKDMTF